jgi:hypothetical protein
MIPPSTKEMRALYDQGKVKELARLLPHVRDRKSKFIEFLAESNLLTMGKHVSDRPVTLGADPEFILCEKTDASKIVLFSSQWLPEYFAVSEAETGADYGLLEFRPKHKRTAAGLVGEINDLHDRFASNYESLSILETEAIEFNHKRARILGAIGAEEDVNYGMHRGKDVDVWSPTSAGNAAGQELVLGQETGMNLSAYKRPSFPSFNDKLLTAGGHIHVGGSLIMMLSMSQLKEFVRRLDKLILPMCKSVETSAGKLRRTVYGNPGEFRLKEYGIEYRSPSNAIFWKKNHKTLLKALDAVVETLKTMARKQTGKKK